MYDKAETVAAELERKLMLESEADVVSKEAEGEVDPGSTEDDAAWEQA